MQRENKIWHFRNESTAVLFCYIGILKALDQFVLPGVGKSKIKEWLQRRQRHNRGELVRKVNIWSVPIHDHSDESLHSIVRFEQLTSTIVVQLSDLSF